METPDLTTYTETNEPGTTGRRVVLSRTPVEDIHLVDLGHAVQPTSARIRHAAAQALSRSNGTTRTVTRVLTALRQGTTTLNANPSIHPQFRSKAVCILYCSHCNMNLCERGMRAILLGNTNIELYSTDRPPWGVALVAKDYFTKNCLCRIRDAACLGCGNVVGYHVTYPCEKCIESCNNGHFWMFLSEAVRPVERMEGSGKRVLRWSAIATLTNGDDGFKAPHEETVQVSR